MIVTTNVKEDDDLISSAKKVAEYFGSQFIFRKKETVRHLVKKYKKLLVVYKDEYVYYEDDLKLFFHPDTAMFRVKNDDDILLNIFKDCKSVFDGTLGRARDSIVLSYAGKKVVGCESSKIIHFIISNGLKNYKTNDVKLNYAMKSVICINEDSLKYLKKCRDKSFDGIYFDPMFTHEIGESENLNSLKIVANNKSLTKELVEEAKRVARKKIVLKAHFRDKSFEEFGFTRHTRKNIKFHYGIIDL